MTVFKKVLVAAAFVTVILGLKGFVSFHVKDNLEAIHEGLWACSRTTTQSLLRSTTLAFM